MTSQDIPFTVALVFTQPTEALYWTQGIVPNVTGDKFYAPQKGIPAPLHLTRYAGHSGWQELRLDCLHSPK